VSTRRKGEPGSKNSIKKLPNLVLLRLAREIH
jgi:hypothetical protein